MFEEQDYSDFTLIKLNTEDLVKITSKHGNKLPFKGICIDINSRTPYMSLVINQVIKLTIVEKRLNAINYNVYIICHGKRKNKAALSNIY